MVCFFKKKLPSPGIWVPFLVLLWLPGLSSKLLRGTSVPTFRSYPPPSSFATNSYPKTFPNHVGRFKCILNCMCHVNLHVLSCMVMTTIFVSVLSLVDVHLWPELRDGSWSYMEGVISRYLSLRGEWWSGAPSIAASRHNFRRGKSIRGENNALSTYMDLKYSIRSYLEW